MKQINQSSCFSWLGNERIYCHADDLDFFYFWKRFVVTWLLPRCCEDNCVSLDFTWFEVCVSHCYIRPTEWTSWMRFCDFHVRSLGENGSAYMTWEATLDYHFLYSVFLSIVSRLRNNSLARMMLRINLQTCRFRYETCRFSDNPLVYMLRVCPYQLNLECGWYTVVTELAFDIYPSNSIGGLNKVRFKHPLYTR